jgi:hypothetical protein
VNDVQPGYREPGRPRRRVKKWQGADWTPPNANAEPGEGAYCRRCNKRHGYKTMGFQVERRGEKWYMMWSCPNFLHVIEDTALGEADPDKPMKRIDFSQMTPTDWNEGE